MAINYVFNECKGDDIREDSWAEWDEYKQEMVLSLLHGEWWCKDCNAYCEIKEIKIDGRTRKPVMNNWGELK